MRVEFDKYETSLEEIQKQATELFEKYFSEHVTKLYLVRAWDIDVKDWRRKLNRQKTADELYAFVKKLEYYVKAKWANLIVVRIEDSGFYINVRRKPFARGAMPIEIAAFGIVPLTNS